MHAILGQKQYQTQKFREDGKRIPVTVVEVENNPVIAVKTLDKDGYWAIQIGYATQKNPNKSLQGHTKGAAIKAAPRFLREVRFADVQSADEMPKVGDFISLSAVLTPGDVIDVIGMSKGKGFAGGVKRYHFQGGPATHGQSDRHRAPGSIGSGTTPGRVYKGKRMAGKMGFEQVTVRNLVVAAIDGKNLWIDGLIPGALKGLVMVTKVGEDKKFVPVLGMTKAVVEELDSSAAPQNDKQEEAEVVEEVKTEVAAPVEEETKEPVNEDKKEEVRA